MKRLLTIYLPIAILTLVICLPFLFPARLIWSTANSFAPQLIPAAITIGKRRYPISVTNVEGAFWQGSADLAIDNLPLGNISWAMQLSGSGAGPATRLNLTGPEHDLDALVSGSTRQLHISHLNGQINAAAIEPFSANAGLYPDGTLLIEEINIELENNWPTELSGRLDWSGGSVRYKNQAALATYTLPPLTGNIAMLDAALELDILTSDNALSVIETRLKPTGWGLVKVKRRFFDLAGKKWLAMDSANDIALEIEQKLW